MAKDFIVSLQGEEQPNWAYGHQKSYVWYFENEHGEQWVAKREGDILRFTGLDIGWQEIILTLEQAVAERNRLKSYLLYSSFEKTFSGTPLFHNVKEQLVQVAVAGEDDIKLPLAEWIFNDAEIYWIVSVLEASIPLMEWARRKKEE